MMICRDHGDFSSAFNYVMTSYDFSWCLDGDLKVFSRG